MRTYQIPETSEEAPLSCPFLCGAGLHPDLFGQIFADLRKPRAIAVYFCGTYFWDNGGIDIGSGCISVIGRK